MSLVESGSTPTDLCRSFSTEPLTVNGWLKAQGSPFYLGKHIHILHSDSPPIERQRGQMKHSSFLVRADDPMDEIMRFGLSQEAVLLHEAKVSALKMGSHAGARSAAGMALRMMKSSPKRRTIQECCPV